MRLLLLSSALLFTGCSFTVATGFKECEADGDCEGGQICRENYCIGNTVPPGCGETYGAKDDPNALNIGVALPITPAPNSTDQSEIAGLNSIKLAVDEVNQRTVAGKAIALHICDTEADSDKVKAMAEWLITDQKSVAIITSGSGQTIAASTVTIPKKTVLMSATSTSPEVTSLSATPAGSQRLVWRTAPSDAIQGKVIVNVLNTDANFTGVSKVGVIYVNDPYGQGLKDVLQTEITAPKSVSTFPYERGGDITTAVNNLNTFDPDVTVLIGFADDAVKIIKAAGPNLKVSASHKWFFTDSAKDPSIISGLGAQSSEIQGAYGTAPAQGAGLAYTSFKDSYTAKFGGDPASYAFTSHSYDAVYVLALAMVHASRSGNVTGDGVAIGLTKLSSGTSYRLTPSQFTPAANDLTADKSINVDGASGKLDFDAAKGEAPSPIELWRVNGTGFTTLRNEEP